MSNGDREQTINIIEHEVADRPDILLLEISRTDYHKLMYVLEGVVNVNNKSRLFRIMPIEDANAS